MAFGKLPEDYAQSPKVCEARLGLGLSLIGLKLKEDAKVALEETLTRCGGKAAVAKEAKASLAELKSELKAESKPEPKKKK